MRSSPLNLAAVVLVALVAGCARRTTGVPLGPPMSAPRVWNGLEPGGFAVRLDTLMRRAPAKGDWAPADRPVQITIWSPATAIGTQLYYRDYIGLTANQASLAAPSPNGTAEAIEALKKFVVSLGNTPAAVDEWLNLPVAASWDAPLAERKYPLIVIAQGNYHSAYNQAVLAEYLASRGYVVATSASPFRRERCSAAATRFASRT
jgi:predicted dienelactone hydrolase